jgi:hypothetical protein
LILNDATKTLGNNSFIKSITYEQTWVVPDYDWNNMSTSVYLSTSVSKMYDIVLFIELSKYSSTYPTVYNSLVINTVLCGEYAGCIFMHYMPTSWTAGYSNSSNINLGPYIEYNVSPTSEVYFRLNGTSIERYCTKWVRNVDYMLLGRKSNSYLIYGVMLEDHIANYVH